jgi:DNA-binding transcriptional regulator YdaS (Cro superfamily)
MSIQKAISILGSQAAVARALGVKPPNVTYWAESGVVPYNHVLKLCAACKWQVTPHQLNPAVYPNERDGIPPRKRVKA